MSLVHSGAKHLIAEFGEYVKVYSEEPDSPEDPNDPIYFESSSGQEEFEEYKVRLYTSPSKEMMEDYGFDEDSDALMYSTEDIADNGDTVEYEPSDRKWTIEKTSTNQIGSGPYLYLYAMRGI